MFYSIDTTTWKFELLCDAYRKDRMNMAEKERMLSSARIHRSWQMRFSCAICKMLYYRLISPLYHRMKRQIEATGAV